MRATAILLALGVLPACSGDAPTRPGPGQEVVRLELAAPQAAAAVLRITGPAVTAISGSPTDWLIETTIVGAQSTVIVFGASLTGTLGILEGVTPSQAGLVSVRVLDAAGAGNQPIDPGVVVARVVVDTIR